MIRFLVLVEVGTDFTTGFLAVLAVTVDSVVVADFTTDFLAVLAVTVDSTGFLAEGFLVVGFLVGLKVSMLDGSIITIGSVVVDGSASSPNLLLENKLNFGILRFFFVCGGGNGTSLVSIDGNNFSALV